MEVLYFLIALIFSRYTRNLVDKGNDRYNLMILCWGEGHGSAIHDHANAHCFMKMLQGSLEEIRFAWPEKEGEELKQTKRTRLNLNDVCYINGKLWKFFDLESGINRVLLYLVLITRLSSE